MYNLALSFHNTCFFSQLRFLSWQSRLHHLSSTFPASHCPRSTSRECKCTFYAQFMITLTSLSLWLCRSSSPMTAYSEVLRKTLWTLQLQVLTTLPLYLERALWSTTPLVSLSLHNTTEFTFLKSFFPCNFQEVFNSIFNPLIQAHLDALEGMYIYIYIYMVCT